MPITYHVHDNGHFIHAVAKGVITSEEFVEYEIAHIDDSRVKPPVVELFEIQQGARKQVSLNEVAQVRLRLKDKLKSPRSHRCAIVASYSDDEAWDLARFYQTMVELHYPNTVIIFGDVDIARIWLGVEHIPLKVEPKTKK